MKKENSVGTRLLNVVRNKDNSSVITILISLIVLFVIFSILSPYFLTWRNIGNLLKYSSILGIAACGYTLVILAGSLDLSTGAICAICATYSAFFLSLSNSWVVGVLSGVLIGFTCGLVNAFFITKVKINPLITTLGTTTIFRGIAYLCHNGQSIMVYSADFKKIGQGNLFGIPNAVIYLLLVFLITYLVLKYTKFGRRIYSVGGNPQASFLAGVNVDRIRFWVYVIAAMCAGVSGILYASITASGAPSCESELALEAISAVVLGGAALSGGKGSVVGTFFGMMILATITNGLSLLGVNSFVQMICKGLILIISVSLDFIRFRKARTVNA